MQMKNVKKFLLLGAVAALGSCTTAHAQFSKRQVFEPQVFEAIVMDGSASMSITSARVSSIVIDHAKNIVVYDGRTKVELGNCGDTSWYCVSDGYIEFAVRRNWKGESGVWSHAGMKYATLDIALTQYSSA